MSKFATSFLFWLVWTTQVLIGVQGLIENGSCNLLVFVPFTYLNDDGTYFSFRASDEDIDIEDFTTFNNLGYAHMAAALLAMDHFNNRDSTVVPELGDEVYSNCNVRIDINNTRVYDTGISTPRSGQLALRDMQKNGDPCAIAGPYNDIPAEILSVFAASAEIPLVAHRAFNVRVVNPFYSSYTSLVYPDQIANAEALVSFLQYKDRTEFVAVLYNLGDSPSQQADLVSLTLDEAGVEHRPYRYLIEDPDAATTEKATLPAVFQKIKEDGFRTIVAIMESPEKEIRLLAEAADDQGMTEPGEYFWIFVGVDLSVFTYLPIDIDNISLKFLAGAALLSPMENFQVDPNDRFLKSWKESNESFVDRVNNLNSIEEGLPGYYIGDSEYFTRNGPVSGAGFMYDAVMATGIGACLAEESNGTITGTSHRDGIRSVDFRGATGRLVIGNTNEFPGGRNASFLKYGIINLFPPPDENLQEDQFFTNEDNRTSLFTISDTLESSGGSLFESTWTELVPFVFRSGKTTPPELSRTPPEQNYLDKPIRAVGLTLMSIALIACAACAIWVFVHRKHRIVTASQPYSLYLICFGSFVTATTILPLSFDESYGWSTNQLDKACMSVLWLTAIGHMITYGSLFSKLWRVNKVLQFQRRTVLVKNVAWPAVSLFIIAVGLLITMTSVAPLQWDRKEIDEFTGESIARCSSEQFGAFIWSIAIVMIVPTILTAFMAWKTNDVDDALSESSWIFTMVVVQLAVIVLAIPLVAVLRDEDTTGRYFGVTLLLWTFPASTLGLLMLPKIIAHWKDTHGRDKARPTRGSVAAGGGAGAVHVSGVPTGTVNGSSGAPNPADDESLPATD